MSSNASFGSEKRFAWSAGPPSPGEVPSAGRAGSGSPGISFSHIYVERGAEGHDDARRILALFPDAVTIPVDDYKEIFSRPNQDFRLQKSDNKLILAVKKDNFLYRGSERINSFDDQHLYYNSLIRNCLFDCDYCFLQGMHPSAYIVVYVNGEEFFRATDRRLSQGPLTVSISYLTDLLGLEGLLPFCRRWIEFARRREGLTIEIRTKSDNYRAIRDLPAAKNVVLAWTMSPQAIAARYEGGTASFKNRLFALRNAVEDGWRVRLCFDPLIRVDGWEARYRECIEEIFARVPAGGIEGVSVGVLRMSTSHLRVMRSSRLGSDLLGQSLEVSHGSATYPAEVEREMRETVAQMLGEHLDRGRISFVGG